jgi:hypothetical protein
MHSLASIIPGGVKKGGLWVLGYDKRNALMHERKRGDGYSSM